MTKSEFDLEQEYLEAQEKVRSPKASDKDRAAYRTARDAFAKARQDRKIWETEQGLRPTFGGVKVDEE